MVQYVFVFGYKKPLRCSSNDNNRLIEKDDTFKDWKIVTVKLSN